MNWPCSDGSETTTPTNPDISPLLPDLPYRLQQDLRSKRPQPNPPRKTKKKKQERGDHPRPRARRVDGRVAARRGDRGKGGGGTRVGVPSEFLATIRRRRRSPEVLSLRWGEKRRRVGNGVVAPPRFRGGGRGEGKWWRRGQEVRWVGFVCLFCLFIRWYVSDFRFPQG